jgi:hypothetical protein
MVVINWPIGLTSGKPDVDAVEDAIREVCRKGSIGLTYVKVQGQ